jgi:hypothetical protein
MMCLSMGTGLKNPDFSDFRMFDPPIRVIRVLNFT